jgi:hypothetical protein
VIRVSAIDGEAKHVRMRRAREMACFMVSSFGRTGQVAY